MLGVSIDSIFSHKVYSLTLGELWFPLLADFHPKGDVAEKFGIMTGDGYSKRACFLIDKEGVVRLSEVYERGIPDTQGLIEAAQGL